MDKIEKSEKQLDFLTQNGKVNKEYILGCIFLEWLEKHKDKSIGEICALLYNKDD